MPLSLSLFYPLLFGWPSSVLLLDVATPCGGDNNFQHQKQAVLPLRRKKRNTCRVLSFLWVALASGMYVAAMLFTPAMRGGAWRSINVAALVPTGAPSTPKDAATMPSDRGDGLAAAVKVATPGGPPITIVTGGQAPVDPGRATTTAAQADGRSTPSGSASGPRGILSAAKKHASGANLQKRAKNAGRLTSTSSTPDDNGTTPLKIAEAGSKTTPPAGKSTTGSKGKAAERNVPVGSTPTSTSTASPISGGSKKVGEVKDGTNQKKPGKSLAGGVIHNNGGGGGFRSPGGNGSTGNSTSTTSSAAVAARHEVDEPEEQLEPLECIPCDVMFRKVEETQFGTNVQNVTVQVRAAMGEGWSRVRDSFQFLLCFFRPSTPRNRPTE